jgi:ribonuclease P protein subunit POP4
MTPITAHNITRHELVGLKVRIVRSTCNSHLGLEGEIIDETKNMLTIQSEDKTRKVPKDSSDFQLKLPNGSVVEVQGTILLGRPEERTKKTVRRRWQ